MSMKGLLVLALIGIALAASQPSTAQTAPAPSNVAVRVTEARKANAALMRQYSWTSRTEVMDQGQYTLSTAGEVQEFMAGAVATGPDASGLFELTGRNVLQPGDTFSLWVDPLTRHARKVQVASIFQGDPVNLTATFKTLPSGLNHVAYAELTVPAKQMSVQVQHFDYNRNN
jgi:hypothetical protein